MTEQQLIHEALSRTRWLNLTERDYRIFETIHAFDGMLGARQIQALHFDSWRSTRGRLSKLYQHGYLSRATKKDRPGMPDMVYWLAERGAEALAEWNGEPVEEFHWRREPKWSRVAHDLRVNDFRITVGKACAKRADFELEEWIPESEFWAHPDVIAYQLAGHKMRRGIRPDGFFVIRYLKPGEEKWYNRRMLLEMDMRTEDNPRFGREKAIPGIAYLRSEAYKQRFGYQSGRWLIVTTGQRRMLNMKRQTETLLGSDAGAFYFTWFDRVNEDTLLTTPIWYKGGEEQPLPLFPL